MYHRIRRGSRFVQGAIKEIGANLVAAQLYPLGLFDKEPVARKHSSLAQNPRPILLVHGIIHNRSAFISLKRRLEKLNWENIYTINYSTFHGNVLQMVEELSYRVDSLLKKTGAKQIDIVAHSLGGIVARTYMSLGEGRGKVRRLITLGTPHQGTALSFFAKGLSRGALDNDLRVNSYLIKLLKNTVLPKSSEVVSIYSPFDWTVVPGENAAALGEPKNSFKNIRFEYVGHAGLLYSDEVFDALVRSILVPEK